MRVFSISDKEAPVAAVRSWLSRHPHVAHKIHHRKLEFIVRDILRDYCQCDFNLTTQTRDRGIDLYSFETDQGGLIVEVKGFGPAHKVDVRVVRSLAGVLVRENACRGLIVTTSTFTRDAQKEAKALAQPTQRYPLDIDLKSVSELLASLRVSDTRTSHSDTKAYWESTIRPLAKGNFPTH